MEAPIWNELNWYEHEKPLRRCSVQMLVTQDVFWPGCTVHNGWVGWCWKRHIGSRWGLVVGCVRIRTWEIHMSPTLSERSHRIIQYYTWLISWSYVIIQHWCIDGANGIDVSSVFSASSQWPPGTFRRGERAKNMSRDHKPELKSERNRIYKATCCSEAWCLVNI